MDNWDKRVQATVFIWIGYAIAVGLATAGGDFSNSNDVDIVLIGSITALLATAMAWYFGTERSTTNNLSETEKTKRDESAPITLLMDLMDEDERHEFKERLKRRVLRDYDDSDGELSSLATLLDEESSRQQRS